MRYRRNSAAVSLSVEDVIGIAESDGLTALASKLRRDSGYAAKTVAKLNAIIALAAAKKAAADAEAARIAAESAKVVAAAEESGPLTDRQGWTMLADLVTPSVLPDLTDEERSALRAAFLEEAAKAA